MRILHILDHSIPLHSGYTFRTLSLLREQRARGWQTFHLTSPKQGQSTVLQETVDGWSFHRTPLREIAMSGVYEYALMRALKKRLRALALRIRPDILHAHSPVLNAWPAVQIGAELGIPVVYEVRAFWEDAAVDHGTTYQNSLRYRLTRAFETAALRRVAEVFTICEGLKADIVARGIAAERVTVIPNAVNIEQFQFESSQNAAIPLVLALDGGTTVGFVGSFYAYEGLDLLLQAVARLLPEKPDLRVLLVGGGPQEKALKALARQLGMDQQVIFTGRVPHDQVHAFYQQIDVLVYPRRSMRLTELVTPLKPLEAMAQGRIFMASDVGGHRELIQHGDNGILFEAGNADALAAGLSDLLTQREQWAGLRARGRLFVEQQRNWTNSVARYAPVYQRLLQQGSGCHSSVV